MSASMRASIVIANHNYARFVEAAIESALGQIGGDVQVIVVDDGSTDDSLDVIRVYEDRVAVVAQANGGQGAALNAGFDRVTTPIVVFLDADDLLAPDLVDRLVSTFDDLGVARVQFPLDLIDASGQALLGTMPPDPSQLTRGDVARRLARFPDDLTWQPTSGNAFRTSVLTPVLPMPTEPYRICADYYLSNLSVLRGDVVVLDRPGGSYRLHGGNSHYTEQWSLAAIRQNVVRTSVTNRLLVDHARGLDVELPDDAARLRSVTALCNRMVSLRLASDAHPIETDSRAGLVRIGVEAAAGRFDLPVIRRIAIAAWFVVMAVVPCRFARRVAGPFVRIRSDDEEVAPVHHRRAEDADEPTS